MHIFTYHVYMFVMMIKLLICALCLVPSSSYQCSDQTHLNDLEDLAKAAGKGKWAKENNENMVRDIKWNIENPRNFVDSLHQKPVDGRSMRGISVGGAREHFVSPYPTIDEKYGKTPPPGIHPPFWLSFFFFIKNFTSPPIQICPSFSWNSYWYFQRTKSTPECCGCGKDLYFTNYSFKILAHMTALVVLVLFLTLVSP